MKPITKSAGYSGTPLVRKLGIKPGARIQVVSEPPDFRSVLGPMPEGVKPSPRGELDFAMVFTRTIADLEKRFVVLRDRLAPNGSLWVSWPKKSSGVPTELTENVVRDFGLEHGLVDVKVCAVDETWSGLKFVRRLKDR
ncbi:MAG TPA: DUF3052 domain-containing protein [Gemmatimonadaceae bacterium]|nr:DUF3052 domain-containing protein [Gemmatimonadaceae bacterium]